MMIRSCIDKPRFYLKDNHDGAGKPDGANIMGLRQQYEDYLPVTLDHAGRI